MVTERARRPDDISRDVSSLLQAALMAAPLQYLPQLFVIDDRHDMHFHEVAPL